MKIQIHTLLFDAWGVPYWSVFPYAITSKGKPYMHDQSCFFGMN